MSKYLIYGTLIGSFCLILTFQNCGGHSASQNGVQTQPGVANNSVNLTGTIMSVSLEGCGKVIVADRGSGTAASPAIQYVPRGIDTSTLVDGTQVQLIGTLATDVVSSCMIGPIVNVTSLQQIH